jgi:hypothetical protein
MSQPQLLVQTKVQIRQDVISKLGLVETLGLVRVSIQESLKDCFNTKELNVLHFRLVPWVNGVKWRKANGLERLKPKDGRVRFNGAAMAGPPNQNPKGRRLIPV